MFYIMKDENDKYGVRDWVLETDCPEDELLKLVSYAHMLGSGELTEVDGIDFSGCWGDDEFLFALLEHSKYSCNSVEATTFWW